MCNNLIICVVIIIILGYFLVNLKETFQASQDSGEGAFYGISGPSRINTLQREQDMKIDALDEQLQILTHINNDNVKANDVSYKKISLGDSVACREIPPYEPDEKKGTQARILKYFAGNTDIEISPEVVNHLSNIL